MTNEERSQLEEMKLEEQKIINRMAEIRGMDDPIPYKDEFETKREAADSLQTKIYNLINRDREATPISEEKRNEIKRQMSDSLKGLTGKQSDREDVRVRETVMRILKEEGYAPDALLEKRIDNASDHRNRVRGLRRDEQPLIMRAGDIAFVERLKSLAGFFDGSSSGQIDRSDIQRANGFLAFTTSDGGNLIPDDTAFQERFHEVQKDFGGLEKVSTVWRRPTGRDIPLNMLDDTDAGGAAEKAEGMVASNPADVTVGDSTDNITLTARTLKANTYTSGKIPYTWEFEDDYPMALMQLAKLAGRRTARKYTADYVSGDGTGRRPRGILTDAAKGLDLTWDNSEGGFTNEHRVIGDICDAIDYAYAVMPGAAVCMNQKTLTELRVMAGTDGHPIWKELQWRSRDDQPMIGSMVVQIDNNYPVLSKTNTETTKIMTVGDHREYWILEVSGMRTIVDPISEYGNIFYTLVVRRGGVLVDTKAVTHVLATAQA